MAETEARALAEDSALPPIPAKRYFTIGEVGELCGVKPHVLRYWEQEFTQLRPVKRRGNRRYYQHHEVLLVRRIRDLLYDQGFTIQGARNRLDTIGGAAALRRAMLGGEGQGEDGINGSDALLHPDVQAGGADALPEGERIRRELLEIRDLLRMALR